MASLLMFPNVYVTVASSYLPPSKWPQQLSLPFLLATLFTLHYSTTGVACTPLCVQWTHLNMHMLSPLLPVAGWLWIDHRGLPWRQGCTGTVMLSSNLTARCSVAILSGLPFTLIQNELDIRDTLTSWYSPRFAHHKRSYKLREVQHSEVAAKWEQSVRLWH